MSKLYVILFTLYSYSSFSQVDSIVLIGKNFGRNLIVQNPFNPNGVGYCVKKVTINGNISEVYSNGSIFEIDFGLNKIKENSNVIIKVYHTSGCKPIVYNPESITNSNIESLSKLNDEASKSNYSLNDKSICIINGKISLDNKKSTFFDCWIQIINKSKFNANFHPGSSSPDSKGKYLGLVKFDDLYELNVNLFDQNSVELNKKILIDLRGVPEDKKRGQMINIDIQIQQNLDSRFRKLNSEFPISKLYYNSVSQTLEWDEDYAKAITSATDILSKQITQENNLKEIELKGRLNELEIEKNKSDLLSKGLEINNQKNEIEKQTLDKKIKEKEIKEKSLLIDQEQKQKKYLYAIISVVFLITIGAIYAFFRQRKLRRLVDAQKTEVEHQKHLVEEKHREITDSINYAERIQRSFLATKEQLDEKLKDFFVLFQPKDVVSGDFYWAHPLQNGNFALVTADSTGHGVPGAIMSLLNTSSLEKAVELGISEPAEILNHTRQTIIERLKKDGSAEGGKDGMDCSLISFNKDKTQLVYAAANNPIWIVRQNELIELKSDKMPVGKHDKDSVSFTQHEVELQTGDMIYALTDGFPDQFGGPKGKKFMYKKLKELLVSIAHQSSKEQQSVLKDTLKDWMGPTEQVDDITVIGVRV